MLWFTISSITSHVMAHHLIYLISCYGSPSHLFHLMLWFTVSSNIMGHDLISCYGSPSHLSHLMVLFTVSSISSYFMVHHLIYLISSYGSPSHSCHLKLWFNMSPISSYVMVHRPIYLILCYCSHLIYLISYYGSPSHIIPKLGSRFVEVLMEAPVIRARSHSLPSTTYTLVLTHNTHP